MKIDESQMGTQGTSSS